MNAGGRRRTQQNKMRHRRRTAGSTATCQLLKPAMWGESTTPGLSVWGPRKTKKAEEEPTEALKLPPMSPDKAKDKSGKPIAPSRPTKENQVLVLIARKAFSGARDPWWARRRATAVRN